MSDTENTPPLESTDTFERLLACQKFLSNELREECVKRFGQDIFANYVFPYYEDMLECVEEHIEQLGERSILDEEFAYTPDDTETYNFENEE